jgi:ElaB/YqjD/DUF883 family membrane-anchored ribosome-binding protein
MADDSDSKSGKVNRRTKHIRKSRKESTAMPEEYTQDPNENSTPPGPTFESAKSHAKEAAEELRAAAEAKAREFRDKATAKAHDLRGKAEAKAQEFREKAEHTYQEARERTRTLQEDGEAYIRENPAKAVLTALAAGFVLGLLLRR